mgnify:CR=1 FL=1
MHVMIDLETMGTKPGSAIIAIGAVAFDKHGIVGDFYQVIDLRLTVAAGLTIDPDTVLWWMKQSDAARAEFERPGDSLYNALHLFKEFYHKMEGKELWGNGSDFDNVLLASAYHAVEFVPLWKFWDNRCYRTLKNLYPTVKHERTGTHHNALEDARYQAEHLLKIVEVKGIEL